MIESLKHDPTLPEARTAGQSYRSDLAATRNNIAHGNLGVRPNGDVLLGTSRVCEDFLNAPAGTNTSTTVARMIPSSMDEEVDALARLDAIAQAWAQLLCIFDVWLTEKVLSEQYPPGSVPSAAYKMMVGYTQAASQQE